jgi:hypothetical protein
MTGKPTVETLGIDYRRPVLAALGGRGGRHRGRLHRQRDGPAGEWVLMRVVGDPAEEVLVYDRHEWECFLDGIRKGEFDDALG